MCQTSPVRLVSGDKGMTCDGWRSVMLSNRSSSIRVAPREWMAKLIPSGLTVGPNGSGSPGNRFVIVGMTRQAVSPLQGFGISIARLGTAAPPPFMIYITSPAPGESRRKNVTGPRFAASTDGFATPGGRCAPPMADDGLWYKD